MILFVCTLTALEVGRRSKCRSSGNNSSEGDDGKLHGIKVLVVDMLCDERIYKPVGGDVDRVSVSSCQHD